MMRRQRDVRRGSTIRAQSATRTTPMMIATTKPRKPPINKPAISSEATPMTVVMTSPIGSLPG